ncbi:unnamed protein product [Clonostachys byssicola]|uniref:AB hydrolase-1 domain-containing protein n=1 Tax=Clonostachys byssicola TaxID=160290 RepID=A0A9N9UIQ4_9HYPO|nr:unnamed protein product [Clonostachys byssicola]
MSSTHRDSTSLKYDFHHENTTHTFDIKWTSLGDPKSPPVILIHGTPWSSRVWTPFALSLSRQFHVYIFDRPGFGDSSPERLQPGTADSGDPVIKYDGDLARQAEVFAALFKSWEAHWGGQKPHVVAHDNAGLVSLRAHLLHHCDYASLCLIDVVAIGPFGQPLFKAIGENPALFERLPATAFEGILESYIRDAAYHDLSKDTVQLLKEPWIREGSGKAGFFRELCQANVRSTDAVEGRYGEVGPKVPVKIIWGADDRWLPAETAQRLGDALKAQEIVIIEQAGHLIMYDQPAQVGVELTRWLLSVGR